jgi:hypothetical protein
MPYALPRVITPLLAAERNGVNRPTVPAQEQLLQQLIASTAWV